MLTQDPTIGGMRFTLKCYREFLLEKWYVKNCQCENLRINVSKEGVLLEKICGKDIKDFFLVSTQSEEWQNSFLYDNQVKNIIDHLI